MRSTVVRHIRVVMPAQDVGRSLEGMVADPPTALCVTVHLAYPGIHTHAYGADQSGLTEIRAKPGPEVVIEIWSAVEGARVQREPVPQGADKPDQERQSQDGHNQAHNPDDSVSRAVRRERRHRRRCGVASSRHPATALGGRGRGLRSRGVRCLSQVPSDPGPRIETEGRTSTSQFCLHKCPSARISASGSPDGGQIGHLDVPPSAASADRGVASNAVTQATQPACDGPGGRLSRQSAGAVSVPSDRSIWSLRPSG
jgi:hypothetical protein